MKLAHRLLENFSKVEAYSGWPKEVPLKKATSADIRKGESYTVINTKKKKILWSRLARESAKAVVAHLNDSDIMYGSSGFIFDKYVSKWSKVD